jgi:hypothetical protein
MGGTSRSRWRGRGVASDVQRNPVADRPAAGAARTSTTKAVVRCDGRRCSVRLSERTVTSSDTTRRPTIVSDGQQNTPAASGSRQQRTIVRRTRKSSEYRRIRSRTYCAGAIIRANIWGITTGKVNPKDREIQMATTTLTNFLGQNWLITPAAPVACNLHQPAAFFDQTWLLVLTGIVEADLKGTSTSGWLNETVTFIPEGLLYTSDFDSDPVGKGPLYWVLNQYGIQRPPLHEYDVCFSLRQGGWAPFVSLSAIFDEGQSINAGFAVNLWRPTHFKKGLKHQTLQPVGNVFTGITVDLGVRDTDAYILKLSYNITLLGRIIFAAQGSLQD